MADVDNALRKADLFQTLQVANEEGIIDQDLLEIEGLVTEETIHKFISMLVDKMFPLAELYRNEEGTIYNVKEKDYKVYKDQIKLIKEGDAVECSSEEDGFVFCYTKESNAYQIYKFLQKVITVAEAERKGVKAPAKKKVAKKKVAKKKERPKTTQEKLDEIIARKRLEREGGR